MGSVRVSLLTHYAIIANLEKDLARSVPLALGNGRYHTQDSNPGGRGVTPYRGRASAVCCFGLIIVTMIA
jgi:hypothetical protein